MEDGEQMFALHERESISARRGKEMKRKTHNSPLARHHALIERRIRTPPSRLNPHQMRIPRHRLPHFLLNPNLPLQILQLSSRGCCRRRGCPTFEGRGESLSEAEGPAEKGVAGGEGEDS